MEPARTVRWTFRLQTGQWTVGETVGGGSDDCRNGAGVPTSDGMSGVPRFAKREPESAGIQGSQLGLDDGTARDEVRLVHDQFASTRAARLSERLRRRGSTKGGMRRSFSPGHGARKPPGVRTVGPDAWGGCRRISSRWPGTSIA
jgi:hypothetical protein